MNRASEDKFTKYRFLSQSPALLPHLPETHLFNQHTFAYMLHKYQQIIVKPIGKGGGFGVIQISAQGDNQYKVHIENKTRIIQGLSDTYHYVKHLTGPLRYLIQRRIPLAQINNRPFDIRVIVQRKKRSHVWKVTGTAAKVAGKGFIVTNNTRSKGTLLPLSVAIQRAISQRTIHENPIGNIKQTSIKIVSRLSRLYPPHRIYGLDIGLDHHGRIFLIEANKYPSMSHFIKLKDYSTYRRIQSIKQGS
ncbi:YheC/D like ATP-grasp [Seinonella peptonophila]|uniref:YheC/D like ATP-grasp n=1 Tax=Seinonella peptonophila TaxID=112248 RepID=A0A1M5BAQ6_9BACL|nr:YheC/YheD family protein [Seinonella peptonophila]SHF39486.1 YheC/D like ATP-grasp [Seinonella peptonophila]